MISTMKSRSCSNDLCDIPLSHYDIQSADGILRQQQNIEKRNRHQLTCRYVSRITAIMAMVTAAATITLLVFPFPADGFSSCFSHRQHHRISRFGPAITSTVTYPERVHSVNGNTPRLFGGRRSSSKLFMAQAGKASDQADWKAILMALQLYKAAYGDLLVPKVFVVPSMAPWPGESFIGTHTS